MGVHGATRELVGEGNLVVNVQTQGGWSYSWQEQRLQLYKTELNMSDAESFCVRMGGHLPSILSREEQIEMTMEIIIKMEASLAAESVAQESR